MPDDREELRVSWPIKQVIVTFTLRGDDAERALDLFGNNLPAETKKMLIEGMALFQRSDLEEAFAETKAELEREPKTDPLRALWDRLFPGEGFPSE